MTVFVAKIQADFAHMQASPTHLTPVVFCLFYTEWNDMQWRIQGVSEERRFLSFPVVFQNVWSK